MSDFTAHALLGEQLKRALPPAGRSLVRRFPAAYCWGLQGPDPLFYHEIFVGGGKLTRMAQRLHREHTGEQFCAMTSHVLQKRGTERELLAAYTLGYLCHYAVDHRLHPYVYWLCEELRGKLPPRYWHGIHGRIECRMDDLLYPLLTGGSAVDFPLARLYLLEGSFQAAVGGLYRVVLRTVYREEVPPCEVASAFRTCLGCTGMFYGSSRHAPWLAARLAETLAGKPGALSCHIKGKPWREEPPDLLNLECRDWRNLAEPGTLRRESVPQLLSLALADAQELCGRFLGMLAARRAQPWQLVESFDWGNPRPNEF